MFNGYRKWLKKSRTKSYLQNMDMELVEHKISADAIEI